MTVRIIVGDALTELRKLPTESIDCTVTSVPYWRQRDYGVDGQLGMERQPEQYVEALSGVFAEVRRLTRSDGVCWLNIADKWASGGKGGGGSLSTKRGAWRQLAGEKGWRTPPIGWKDKDLVLAAFMVAERLRQDGWFLRKTVIWAKPNATEPCRLDRPSLSHEYLFLFSKMNDSAARDPGEPWWHSSVGEIAPAHFDDHPAVMPGELVRRAIVSGSSPGGVILDPFSGSGTTLVVADRLGREATGIELNPEYAAMSERRLRADAGMFAQIAAD